VDVRSIDAPRQRPAPQHFSGVTLDGAHVSQEFEGLTLLIAIKSRCDGCRDIINSSLEEFADLRVIFVSATNDDDDEWSDSAHAIIVAPALLAELDIAWPPFYVLIDALTQRVVCEGVVFGPSQIRDEIAEFVAL
jgi:hypothetical protein